MKVPDFWWVIVLSAMVGAAWTMAATPSPTTTVDIPMQGSVKDSVGRVYSAAATVHVEITEPAPPPPPPPPAGVVFGQVTDIFGAPVTAATSGKLLVLHGSGFPMTTDVPPVSPSSLRLAIAGRSVIVSAWTHTAVEFSLPNTVTDPLTASLAGSFEVWKQQAGQWGSLGKGGAFTILPSRAPAARRKR